jgi:ribokinase
VRAAVVGHVELVRFATVERVPDPGSIVLARESWIEPAGGGAVAAVRLRDLAGACDFFVAVGNDDAGGQALQGLERLGLRTHAAIRDAPQRQAFTFLDDRGERTITLLSPKLHPHRSDDLPWDELASIDTVYFTGGDAEALRAARQARVVVATARELRTLQQAAVVLDALVHSGTDLAEGYEPGRLDPEPKLVVTTMGKKGGKFVAGERSGAFAAAPLPGPSADAYGAGDSFAAGLAFALGRGDRVEDALAFASKCGAAAMTVRGAYGGKMAE